MNYSTVFLCWWLNQWSDRPLTGRRSHSTCALSTSCSRNCSRAAARSSAHCRRDRTRAPIATRSAPGDSNRRRSRHHTRGAAPRARCGSRCPARRTSRSTRSDGTPAPARSGSRGSPGGTRNGSHAPASRRRCSGRRSRSADPTATAPDTRRASVRRRRRRRASGPARWPPEARWPRRPDSSPRTHLDAPLPAGSPPAARSAWVGARILLLVKERYINLFDTEIEIIKLKLYL